MTLNQSLLSSFVSMKLVLIVNGSLRFKTGGNYEIHPCISLRQLLLHCSTIYVHVEAYGLRINRAFNFAPGKISEPDTTILIHPNPQIVAPASMPPCDIHSIPGNKKTTARVV